MDKPLPAGVTLKNGILHVTAPRDANGQRRGGIVRGEPRPIDKKRAAAKALAEAAAAAKLGPTPASVH